MMSGTSNEMVSSQPTQYIPPKKEIQTGSLAFIEELKKRSFKSSDEIVDYVEAENLTVDYLEHTGFKCPIIVKKPEGLGLKVPPFKSFRDLENYVGPDLVVELIDVEKQDHIYMPFKNFSTYMETNLEQRTRILNMISCECSCLKLGSFIEPPAIARKIDLVKRFWDEPKLGHTPNLPRSVEKYCLIGSKNAFTDFHIDFGGTSVWYHIVKGGKEFYLIKPTVANINLYWRWSESTNCLTTFFADQVEHCYKCTLTEDMTLFLPSGWIHAVLTTEDSLVFGGNYLHSLNIPSQLEIYNLEVKYKVPVKQRYPYFRELHWFAARGLCDELQNFISQGNIPPEYLVTGLRNLLGALRTWAKMKTQKLKYYNYKLLMKDLAKNLNSAEKLFLKNVPPKPQRGSTRLKRKPAFNDFVVDFTQCKKSRGRSLNIRDNKIQNTSVVNDETHHQNKGETPLETRNNGTVNEDMGRPREREDHQNAETQNENDNELNNYLETSNIEKGNHSMEERRELKVVLTRIPLKSSLSNFDYRIREVRTGQQDCPNVNPVNQNPSTSCSQPKTGSKFLYGKEPEVGKDSVENNIDRLLKSLEGCRLTGSEDESINIINYVRDDEEWEIQPPINSRISRPDTYLCDRCFRHDNTTVCPLLEQKRRRLQQVVPNIQRDFLERGQRLYLCGRCLCHHDTPICPNLGDDLNVRKPVQTTEEKTAIPGPSKSGVRSTAQRFSHYMLTANDDRDLNEPRTDQTHARNLIRMPRVSTPRKRPSNNEVEHIAQDDEFKRITGKTDAQYLGTCTTLQRRPRTYLCERCFSGDDTTIGPDLGQESRTSQQEVVVPSTDGGVLKRRPLSYPCERCFSHDASTICTDLDLSVRKPVQTTEEKTAIPGPSKGGVSSTAQRFTHYLFTTEDDGNFNDSTTDPSNPRKLIIKLPRTSTPRRKPSNNEIEHTTSQEDEFKRITVGTDAHSLHTCTTLERSVSPEHKRPSSPEVEDAIAQDEDFLYFAPEASSGNNRRKTGDKSWSPRSRMSEVQPKPDRTLRKNITKNYIRNMIAAESQPVQEQVQIETSESDTVIVRKRGRPRSSSNIPKVPLAANNRAYNSLLSGTRSQGTQTSPRKKKLKTAKQRLGKILKIGKMLY